MESVNSSIELRTAACTKWAVIVIGAGPAGSVAALVLARSGVSVLLVDKAEHPRFKVCGCCLSEAAVKLLDSIGLKTRLFELNAVPIEKLALHLGKHRADIQLPTGLVISRNALDSELVHQAKEAGAQYLSNTTAHVGDETHESRTVELERDGTIVSAQAKCVLVADGLGGRSLEKIQLLPVETIAHSRIGAGAIAHDYPRHLFDDGVIYMTCGKGGYVGMVKLENGSLDVAAAFDLSFVQSFKSPGEAVSDLIKSTPMSELNVAALNWHGTPPLTRRRVGVSASRLFVVGDAASYAEPFTGEGMLWALTSGLAVAPIIKRALELKCEEFRYSDWDIMHNRLIATKQRMSMSLAQLVRQDKLIEAMIRVLNVAPFLAQPIVRAIEYQPAASQKVTLRG